MWWVAPGLAGVAVVGVAVAVTKATSTGPYYHYWQSLISQMHILLVSVWFCGWLFLLFFVHNAKQGYLLHKFWSSTSCPDALRRKAARSASLRGPCNIGAFSQVGATFSYQQNQIWACGMHAGLHWRDVHKQHSKTWNLFVRGRTSLLVQPVYT